MKRATLFFSALCLCLSATAVDLSRIPAGYDWTFRLDLRAGGDSPFVSRVLDNLFPRNREALSERIRLFKRDSGIDLALDLDEVVFLGNRQLDDPDLVYATGRFDAPLIAQTLARIGARKEIYRKTSLLVCRMRNGGAYFLALPTPGIFLASRRKENVLRAIDCAVGARRGIPASAPSARTLGRAKTRVASMYTGNPQQFGFSPVLSAGLALAKSAELTLDAPGRDRADLRAVLHTDSPQAALGMRQALFAARGLFLYRQDSKELADFTNAAQIAAEGDEVRLHLPMNAKTAVELCKMMQLHKIGRASGQAPRKTEDRAKHVTH